MSKYLQQTLSSLIAKGVVSDDPMSEVALHSVLNYMSPVIDDLYETDQETAEIVAAVVLLAYQEGVEIGWDKHKQTVREMDGSL